MTETTSNPRFQPGQRSIGLGYWERNGRQSYEIVFQAYVQFTGGNYTQGLQRVVQDIDMVDADHWNSTAAVAFTDVNGAPVSPRMHARGRRADAVGRRWRPVGSAPRRPHGQSTPQPVRLIPRGH